MTIKSKCFKAIQDSQEAPAAQQDTPEKILPQLLQKVVRMRKIRCFTRELPCLFYSEKNLNIFNHISYILAIHKNSNLQSRLVKQKWDFQIRNELATVLRSSAACLLFVMLCWTQPSPLVTRCLGLLSLRLLLSSSNGDDENHRLTPLINPSQKNVLTQPMAMLSIVLVEFPHLKANHIEIWKSLWENDK